ncbi:MAG: hypothetical protein U0Z17_00025 [Bacteroidales bacterium]
MLGLKAYPTAVMDVALMIYPHENSESFRIQLTNKGNYSSTRLWIPK